MSDAESFLSRWSRLKQEANTVGRKEPGIASASAVADSVKAGVVAGEPAALAGEPAAVGGESADVAGEPAAVGGESADAVESTRGEVVLSPAPRFDPDSLPAVSSITQASDIRQFLQAGVPAELVRAALRAAWVTDPAIRDFIGIADSQWDFNDPNAMPGFGPLEAADGARAFAQRSVARVNQAAGAVARMPELATRAVVDAANLPREGQVDKVWLSAGMTEQGGSGVGSDDLAPGRLRSVTDLDAVADVHAVPGVDPDLEAGAELDTDADLEPRAELDLEPGEAPDAAGGSGSRPQVGPRVHGTALPKARA